jgi:hypothetical protein
MLDHEGRFTRLNREVGFYSAAARAIVAIHDNSSRVLEQSLTHFKPGHCTFQYDQA